MHEIGALKKAIDLVDQIADDNSIDKIKTITLEIGELTGYLPVFFEKYFPIVIENKSRYIDTKLYMKIVKGQAICSDCQTFYNVMKNKGICPKCYSRNKTVISGQNFLVKDIGY